MKKLYGTYNNRSRLKTKEEQLAKLEHAKNEYPRAVAGAPLLGTNDTGKGDQRCDGVDVKNGRYRACAKSSPMPF